MAINYSAELQAGGNFPLIDSDAVRGGYRSVKTLDDLNKIPESFIKEGMICLVTDDLAFYQYRRYRWVEVKISSGNGAPFGIPILTDLMVLDLGSKIPKEYINIPNPTDLEGQVINNTITTTNNGNYIDILFSAIRALLAEVAKLRNSFKYGINSYNEGNTAMSNALGDMKDPEEEPLWAVEESDLSELHEGTFEMTYENPLIGDVKANAEKHYIKIATLAYFESECYKVLKDPKCFLYLTTTSKNIQFLFESKEDPLILDLDKLISDNKLVNKYNILLIVSKKTTKSELNPTLYGDNFIWILVTDYNDNTNILQGYFTGNSISPSKISLKNLFFLKRVTFNNLDLYKYNSYTKLLDFSEEVIPTFPDDTDYKFGAAHLTIRSISNEDSLKKVLKHLLNNELIWVDNTKKLFIKTKNNLIEIGSNNTLDDMNIEDLIAYLKELNIVVDKKDNGNYELQLNDIASVKFINEDTGKKFKFTVDSEGNLKGRQEDLNTLEKRLSAIKGSNIVNNQNRGFISRLLIGEVNQNSSNKIVDTENVGLLADRVKIGSIYAPYPGLTVYGCSHAYIELENTSESDFNLLGCYLHVAYKGLEGIEVVSLALTGTIKAGSTYLIRGKQYAKFEDSNTVLKVKTFDLEWFNKGKLVDFQRDALNFLLIYNTPEVLALNLEFIHPSTVKSWNVDPNFIDFAPVRNAEVTQWKNKDVTFVVDKFDKIGNRDYIIKNTFELDPAKLAFQALNEKDSSRVRGLKDNDFKAFYIDKPFIEFPNSSEKYDVSLYTPKASFENKNVSTDKSKPDYNKPNMVYCQFGININTTRCFNWVSIGSYDEYVWIRKKGSDTWKKFESYKTVNTLDKVPEPSKSEQVTVEVEEIPFIKDTIYRKPLYKTYKITTTTLTENEPKVDTLQVFVDETNLLNAAYARMLGRFPGEGSFYTAHKCIIVIEDPEILTPTEFEYKVGRADIFGNPIEEHCSKIMSFTLYPENLHAKPRIYQVTDLQGFLWIEYQTWAGSAKALKNKIEEDLKLTQSQGLYIIPIIINTGDMTLNGTRVNEWLDYYRAGECLFNKYEHISVVGNNDLCNTDPTALGTGDDEGKSNGYYHHLFACFEVNDKDLVITGSDGIKRYIPSTYYIECKISSTNYERLLCVNSEITFINCRDWFKLDAGNSEKSYNIYTGWEVGATTEVLNPRYTETFVPIYNTLYKWLLDPNRRTVVACHEMPFTVVTNANLNVTKDITGYNLYSRSLDGKSKNLIGSHLNQITNVDNTSIYWFSRLLEYFKIKLVIGGHKHTYTCTYPVREFYKYKEGDIWKNSLEHGPMKMGPNLKDEFDSKSGSKLEWSFKKTLDNSIHLKNNNGEFIDKLDSFIPDNVEFHSSRIPLVKFSGKVLKVANGSASAYSNEELGYESKAKPYLPIISDPNLTDGVTYFMCQATGYKLTSNKELPGPSLAFTKLLPLTSPGATKDKPSVEQQAPMFAILKYAETGKIQVELARVMNVQIATKAPLYNNKGLYAEADKKPYLEFIYQPEIPESDPDNKGYIAHRYGIWDKLGTEHILLEL